MGGTLGHAAHAAHAGPVRADRDYQIAPPSRIDLEEVLGLIRDEKCFVVDPPRQTGKTSALLALRDLLNSGEAGDFRCLYAKLENGQAMRENVAEAMRAVLAELAYQASGTLGRRDPGRAVARAPGTGRAGPGAAPGAGALVHGRPASAGTRTGRRALPTLSMRRWCRAS